MKNIVAKQRSGNVFIIKVLQHVHFEVSVSIKHKSGRGNMIEHVIQCMIHPVHYVRLC